MPYLSMFWHKQKKQRSLIIERDEREFQIKVYIYICNLHHTLRIINPFTLLFSGLTF